MKNEMEKNDVDKNISINIYDLYIAKYCNKKDKNVMMSLECNLLISIQPHIRASYNIYIYITQHIDFSYQKYEHSVHGFEILLYIYNQGSRITIIH